MVTLRLVMPVAPVMLTDTPVMAVSSREPEPPDILMLPECPAWTFVTVNWAVAVSLGMLAWSLPDALMLITGAEAAVITMVAVNPPDADVVIAPEVTVIVPVELWRVMPTLGLNPVPVTVTVDPDGPLVGLSEMDGVTYGFPAARAGRTKIVPEMANRTASVWMTRVCDSLLNCKMRFEACYHYLAIMPPNMTKHRGRLNGFFTNLRREQGPTLSAGRSPNQTSAGMKARTPTTAWSATIRLTDTPDLEAI